MVVGDVPYYPGQETAGPALRPVKRASGTVQPCRPWSSGAATATGW
jgi:hypothetical protein